MSEPVENVIDRINGLSSQVLSLLNTTCDQTEMIHKLVLLIQKELGFDSVGIRLKDGLDYPYFFTSGFSDTFVKNEMFLCQRDRHNELILDSEGNPSLECMCGNIIAGRFRPEFPFFSEGGSFWTNSTSELLAKTSEKDRHNRTRNRCNSEGYETVGLFPVKANGVNYGLLQINDYNKRRLEAFAIPYFEKLASLIGLVFLSMQMSTELTERMSDTNRLLKQRVAMLEKISNHLKDNIIDDDLSGDADQIAHKIDTVLGEIETLKGISTICSVCKKVKNKTGKWEQIEAFVSGKTALHFSHSYCEPCFEKEMKSLRENNCDIRTNL